MAGRRKSVYSGHGRGTYKYTARRRAALRKAQLESARKRKRNAKYKKVAKVAGGVGVLAAAGGAGVYLGRSDGAKDIRLSVKTAGAFGKDLLSAFKAVEPTKKEKTRKQNAISAKKSKSAAGREAARKYGTFEEIPGVGPAARKALQEEASRSNAPSFLRPDTFNRDGTVNKDILLGRPIDQPLTDKELRSGIARAGHAKAKAGGSGFTNAQKQKMFKEAKAMLAAANKTVVQGTKTKSKVPPIKKSRHIPRDPYDWRTTLDNMRRADDELLQQYSHKVTNVQRTKGVPGHKTDTR